MTLPPRTGTSRRSVLRAVVATGSVAAATPAVVGLSEAASAVSAKKPASCKRSPVRVKGRCKPKKKAKKTKKTAQAPAPPAPAPVTPPVPGPPSTAPGPPPPAPVTLVPFTLLGPGDRHLATRFSYGVDAALAAAVTAAGGAAAWFEQQLTAPGVADPATDQMLGWWPSLSRTPQDIWARQSAGTEQGWQVMSDYQRYLLIRRAASTRPVLDVMTEFWENHLHVPVSGDSQFLYRAAYGATVRDHALGRFEEMLAACITHPAMLLFLSGAVSTAAHPNENLGRELLELHTVGRGRYTENDVKDSARILTGYRVDMWRTWVASYQPGDHATGPVQVMGFTDANANKDGRATAAAYLRYLAHHPATAARIARKLAVKFVSDDPPQSLVDTLARTYLENDTAIVPVLRVLVASPAFAAAAGAKVRDPGEDVVATYRALGIVLQGPASPRRNDSAEANVLWQAGRLGLLPHGWPRPDGAPADNASWSSASRLVSSLDLHCTLSGGWWPKTGVTYLAPAQWLPTPSLRFDALVEHLCRRLLHLTTPPGLLQACCEVVDARPETVISATHSIVKWNLYRVLTTILDSPHHMKR